ncbi:MepB family protein [Sphingobacterium sp. N143]|uniref:MepB family protein n=1 Tax=Sphingobacterium sp. N143 TaxID=2746727 RepID=UPI002577462E|nr:MepB family protein [Sphingobacterium sp. N143]
MGYITVDTMIPELIAIEKAIGRPIHNLVQDQECAPYFGFSFQLGGWNIKFRKAKITPKKNGQFVTLWKRDAQHQTVPYAAADKFDFYLIAAAQGTKFGCFIFPKQLLISQQVLTTGGKNGKRGFRVYPPWCIADNPQAAKTKMWQVDYFIDLTAHDHEVQQKLQALAMC